MSTGPIDYEALAKQYGAVSSAPAATSKAPIDYSKLAAQYGAVASSGPAATKPQPEESFGEKAGHALGTAYSDLKGLLHPSGQNPYPGGQLNYVPPEKRTNGEMFNISDPKRDAAIQAVQQDDARKAAGYNVPYRVLAPVAQSAGLNVPGMEQSAAEGDTAGVLGHAAAGIAPQALVAAHMMRDPTPPPGIPESPGGGIRGKVQAYMGIGDRLVKKVGTEALDTHAEAVQKVADANAKATQAHAEATAKGNLGNQQAAADWYQKQRLVDEQNEVARTRTATENQQAAADHAKQVAATEGLNKAAQEKVAQRAALSQKVVDDSGALWQKTAQLERAVNEGIQQQYSAIEKKVGGATVPTEPLADAVKHARKSIITGTQENIKQFTDIMAQAAKDDEGNGTILMGGAPVAVDALPANIRAQMMQQGIIKPPSAGLGWKYLQGIYSELGRSMYNGSAPLPSDVFNGLKYVREQVGEQMRGLAKQAGVESQWDAARAAHQQYMDTFHNTRPGQYDAANATVKGDSPVAQILRKADPGNVLAIVKNAKGNRLVSMLDAYAGVSPEAAALAKSIRENWQQSQSLPKRYTAKPTPTAPEPGTPSLKEHTPAPEPKPLPDAPTMESAPPPPDLSAAVKEARQAKVGQIAENLGKFNAWDITSWAGAGGAALAGRPEGMIPALGITVLKHGMASILDKPAVVEYLSTPTPKDFTVLSKILKPEEVAATQKAVARVYSSEAAKGNNLPLDPGTRSFLLPGQVTAILAAQGAAAQSQRYSTPEGVMLGMKTGELTNDEGNRLLQKLRGKGSVVRPMAPPR
jgi:hypothetical protein